MKKTKNLTLASIFAALIFVFVAFLQIKYGRGIIHFGDAFIFMAATLLPLPYAMLSAAIGAGLGDLLSGAAIWIPATVIIKPLMVLCCRFKKIGITLAGMLCIAGYFLYEILVYGFAAAATDIPGTVIQTAGNLILYYTICMYIIKVLRKKYL